MYNNYRNITNTAQWNDNLISQKPQNLDSIVSRSKISQSTSNLELYLSIYNQTIKRVGINATSTITLNWMVIDFSGFDSLSITKI